MIPFFDLDWTLIKGGSPVHRNAFLYALKKAFAINPDFNAFDLQGMIDSGIFLKLAINSGVDEDRAKSFLPQLIADENIYFKENSISTNFYAMPGAQDLLLTLKNAQIPIGVLTGNTSVIGRIKLKKTGLLKYINYEIYDTNNLSRSILVKRAKELVKREIVIVGDTPRDVECAKNNQVKCIAVTTGKYDKSFFNDADLVIESLEQKDQILNFLQKAV